MTLKADIQKGIDDLESGRYTVLGDTFVEKIIKVIP